MSFLFFYEQCVFAAVCNVVLNGLLLIHQTQPVFGYIVCTIYVQWTTQSMRGSFYLSCTFYTLLCQHNLLDLLEGKPINRGKYQWTRKCLIHAISSFILQTKRYYSQHVCTYLNRGKGKETGSINVTTWFRCKNEWIIFQLKNKNAVFFLKYAQLISRIKITVA